MTQRADIILTNALVLTMDEKLAQYFPGALAVLNDSILAVGPEAEILASFEASEKLDCGGKTLMLASSKGMARAPAEPWRKPNCTASSTRRRATPKSPSLMSPTRLRSISG